MLIFQHIRVSAEGKVMERHTPLLKPALHIRISLAKSKTEEQEEPHVNQLSITNPDGTEIIHVT